MRFENSREIRRRGVPNDFRNLGYRVRGCSQQLLGLIDAQPIDITDQ